MPHLKTRYLISLLEKRLRFSPVVAIQGVRQCGKSTLARDLLPSTQKEIYYRTLDQPSALKVIEAKKVSLFALYGGSSPQFHRKEGLKVLPWDCLG